MNIWNLVNDFLCKKKVQEELNSYDDQYNLMVIFTTLTTLSMMYNMYSYRKLKRNYDELKKTSVLDENIKKIYNDLCVRTESSSESDYDSDSTESLSDKESEEYNMEDIDINN